MKLFFASVTHVSQIGVREQIERKKERKYIYWTAHTSKTDTEVTKKKKTEVNTHK
jgi:hypothetical protein